MRKLLKSKTMIFNAALAVLGVLELHSAALQKLIGPEHFGSFMLGLAIAGALLRFATTKPLSEK
jgi:O-antigen/teichoic acid export membrane protein